jgi:serine/threonine-protein kinase
MALRRPSADPLLERVLKDTYRVTVYVGQSSLGRVYKGEHLATNKPIVIKVLGDEVRGADDFVVRFRRDAILQAMVNHPYAVQTLDLDEDEDGTLFVVQESAPGRPLDDVLEEEGRLPPARAINIARQVLEILQVAHESQIIHRELTPDRILLEQRADRDVVRILDFGVSTLVAGDDEPHPRSFLGSPYYMSPEIAAGEPVDARTDLYAVGVILYEMLTGKRPLEEQNLDEFHDKLQAEYPPRITREFPRLKVPPEVEDLVFTSLSKDPYNRHQTAAEMLEILSGVASHRTRNFLLIAVVVLLAGGLGIYFLLGRSSFDQELEDRTVAAKEAANPEHPSYAKGMLLLQDAEKLREDGEFAAAHEKLMEARREFVACVPYDSTHEAAARLARGPAMTHQPEHPVTRLGTQEYQLGGARKAQGLYQEAYDHFRLATVYFSYDSSIEENALEAQAEADPSHPEFSLAEEKLTLARRALEQRPLTEESLTQAQDLFAEALTHYRKAVPYDDTAEEAARSARDAADSANPRYPELVERLGQAVAARDRGNYDTAYQIFAEVEEGFRQIAVQYDPGPEQAAGIARRASNPDSEAFRQGQRAWDDAIEAKDTGNYDLAYARFREAKDLFQLAAYDDTIERLAIRARDSASRDHPEFAQGQTEFERANQLKAERRYDEALLAFNRAKQHFLQALAYDSGLENLAREAMERAYSGMPVTYPRGREAWESGLRARDRYDYETAYAAFKEARRYFQRAEFDPALQTDVQQAREGRDVASPQFLQGQSHAMSARRAFDDGDGPAATREFRQALTFFRTAPLAGIRTSSSGASTSSSGGSSSGGIGSSSSGGSSSSSGGGSRNRQDRQLAREARKARSAASELKGVCDEWSRNRQMNPRTRRYYEEGLRLFAQAEQHYEGKRWAEATEGFQEALAELKKVDNKVR